MSLELAVAFVRVKTDRAQLRSEMERTRKLIIRRLSGITIPVTLKVSNLAAIQRELRGISTRIGQNVGQQMQAGVQRGMRGAPASAASQAAAAGMMMGSPPLGGRGGRAMGRASTAQTFPQILAAGLSHGGQRFNTGPSGGVFAGMGQLTPQQFRSRAKLLQQSNRMRAGGRGGGRGGGQGAGGFFAGGRFSRMGAMGTAGRFASGFGFATAPMLTAGHMFGGPAGAAGMGAGMLAAGAGRFAVGQGIEAVKTFADFEKEFRRVEVVQREAGALQDDIERLRQQARQLGRSTVFSAGESAQAMVLLSQRGFSATEVFEQMPHTLSLAAAGQLDLAKAADVASSSLRVFQMESKDTEKVADILTTSFLESAANIEDVAVALRFIGPSARIAGKGMAETVAGIMALRNAGMTPSMAGTAMDRILTFMGVPEKRAKMEKAGIFPVTDKGEIISIAKFLEQSAAAMEKMTEAERLAFQNDVFGFRGGKGFGAMLATQASDMEAQVTRLNDSTGKAADVSGEMMSIVDAQMKQVSDSIEELRVAFVSAFGTDVRDAIAATAAAIRLVSDEVENTNKSSKDAGFANAAAFVMTAPGRFVANKLEEGEKAQEFLGKLRERREKQEQDQRDNRRKQRQQQMDEAFGPEFLEEIIRENPREAFNVIKGDPEVRKALSGLLQGGKSTLGGARGAAPAVGAISPVLGAIMQGIGGGPGMTPQELSNQRMTQLRQSGLLGAGQRFGFDVMENVQRGGLGNAFGDFPGLTGRKPISPQNAAGNRITEILLNQIMPGAGTALGMVPGGAGTLLSGAKSLFGAPSQQQSLAQAGRPGIFGIEEFQRQVQMGALGPDKGMQKIEDNTGKTKDNTGKSKDILHDIFGVLQDGLGLG